MVASIKLHAVTFDDYNTLRYSPEQEDIIYPILRNLRKEGIILDEESFLREYYRADRAYRKRLSETYRESLLDKIVADAMRNLGFRVNYKYRIVSTAVEEGLRTRYNFWYPDSIETLTELRSRGYILGLISNTHWRWLREDRMEFQKYLEVITLSYEVGYAKPHPSIFLVTLSRMGVAPRRCLHVGDDPVADVEGARKAGMSTAFIKRGSVDADSDMQIEKLSELLDILKSHSTDEDRSL